MPDPATWELLAQQQARILSELGSARAERADMRADMTVLLAIVQRLDATVSGLTTEVRALHGQIARFRNRLDQMEESK
jgi:predicted  nucleic acid-binding Zn-ribbon protein